MRTLALPLLAAVLLWTMGPAAADEAPAIPAGPKAPAVKAPPPAPLKAITLREACQSRLVEARGERPSSYRKVYLTMRNRTDRPLAVDVCASYLVPERRGSCQRLGIGPTVTPRAKARPWGPGMMVLRLEPKQEVEVQLNTCCLDAGLPAPRQQTFQVAKKALPPVREKVLRWWADNPTAPQGAVNTAIWQSRDTVSVTPGVIPSYRSPVGKFAAVHGGTYYRIDDGELMSKDADGIERFLGTEIFQVIPVEGAVYAVALGEDRRPDLWRLCLTGLEPWGFVMDLDQTDRVQDVIPAADGNLVLVTDAGLRYWNKAGNTLSTSLQTAQILHLSTRLAGKKHMTATVQRPPEAANYRKGEKFGEKAPVYELWSVNLETGKAERIKEYWNVRGMLAGPAGVYGLSHKGRLRVLKRRSFKDLGTEDAYARVLAVGRKVLWLVGADGKLRAASARSGRLRHTIDLEVAALGVVDTDARTDDLAFVKDGSWFRVRAETGAVERVGAATPDASSSR